LIHSWADPWLWIEHNQASLTALGKKPNICSQKKAELGIHNHLLLRFT